MAFYASGIMREIPVIRRIVDGVNPLDPAPQTKDFENAGGSTAMIASALRRWHETFSKVRSDTDRAIVFLLSGPDSPDTVRLDRSITLAPGENGFQGRAYFELEHLKKARSVNELRKLRDEAGA